jgi:hypothetical protein
MVDKLGFVQQDDYLYKENTGKAQPTLMGKTAELLLHIKRL